MQLLKSEKAKLELSSRGRTLSLRERAALLMADGRKTGEEMRVLLQDDGSILQKLMADGYLIIVPKGSMQPGAAMPAPVPLPVMTGAPAVLPDAAPPMAEPVPEAAPAKSGDNFDGKRSLATTRMFLFDICERMFVRKLPALATQFRDQLREARDRESMMVIAREMIRKVEEIAGSERADGLSERIAMLLPSEH